MPPGEYLKLEVSDTGHGMDQKTIEKAFDPFYTTNETGEGTGLGLAIVHAIVDEHDGYLEVLSTPGKGSNFYIYFPIVMEDAEPNDSKLNSLPPLSGNEKIMFVDDEGPIRQTAKKIIESYGYTVVLFENGIEALKEFEKDPDQFDCIVTDMNMPLMAGDKFSIKIKQRRPDIPIILCTGFSETMTEEIAMSFGIKGFLMKPIVMNDLAHKIRQVLDEKVP
jgi:CheY-like chemotaxis protein